jgi:hypothetical protein
MPVVNFKQILFLYDALILYPLFGIVFQNANNSTRWRVIFEGVPTLQSRLINWHCFQPNISPKRVPLIAFSLSVQISTEMLCDLTYTNTVFQAQLVKAAQTMAWKTAP